MVLTLRSHHFITMESINALEILKRATKALD